MMVNIVRVQQSVNSLLLWFSLELAVSQCVCGELDSGDWSESQCSWEVETQSMISDLDLAVHLNASLRGCLLYHLSKRCSSPQWHLVQVFPSFNPRNTKSEERHEQPEGNFRPL